MTSQSHSDSRETSCSKLPRSRAHSSNLYPDCQLHCEIYFSRPRCVS